METLKKWIEDQKVVWLIVREDGSAMLAAPMRMRIDRFLLSSGDAPRTVEECLAVAGAVLRARDLGLQGVVISVPRALPDAQTVEALLQRRGAGVLNQDQQQALKDTGMEVPFGDWAVPGQALLYWISRPEEGAA